MSKQSATARPVKRLRYLTRTIPTKEQRDRLATVSLASFLPMEAIGQHGELDLAQTREIHEVRAGYTLLFDGDVAVAKITPCFENGKGAMIHDAVNGIAYGTTELHVLSPGPELDGRFLYYVTASGPFRKLGEGAMIGAAGQKRVPEDFVRDYKIPVPSLPQQRAIADYLDRETARLDGLIAAKESLLDLLAEKRRALIAHAVTRGLDRAVPLRDSGVPWLGEIPNHWKLVRAKWLFRQSDLSVGDDDEMVTCFRDGQVTLRRNRREEGFTNAIKELGYQGIRAGQLVLHSMDAFAGAIGVSDSDGKCSPEYIICDPIDTQVVSQYFAHLLRVMALNGFIQASCPAVRERAPRIRFSNFGEMFIPLPGRSEQYAIVAHIAAETAKLDALRAAGERTIALLRERRAALIAAAVTGALPIAGLASTDDAENSLPQC